jgi:ATP-dependent DNA helicase RecG
MLTQSREHATRESMAYSKENEDPLKTPVQFLTGVGPARAKLLEKLNIRTIEDLLWYLPKDVIDMTHVSEVLGLREGESQTVRGIVVDRESKDISGNRTMTCVLLDCQGQFVRGVWYNQPWMLQKFREGNVVLFTAKPKFKGGRWEFGNPRVQWIPEDDTSAHGGVVARYGLTEGLKMNDLCRVIRTAVEQYAKDLPEPLPEDFRAQMKLPDLPTALTRLHLPQTTEQYEEGRRRLLFDDLFEFQLGLALRRRAWREQAAAAVLETTAKVDARIRRLFPFAFTNGQNKAIREITADLASGKAMHRLLQADVGAGKTAVAIYAMLVAIAAGYQAVIMAPTEVLTLQHWHTIESALAESRVNRQFLTGSLTPVERRNALQRIRSGETHLVIGTQAVIQQDVEFAKLGVVVIDEQHKFGVRQRARFTTLSDLAPHVLVMTATPIPRSLCLTQFGDLDISIISELPPGRQRIVTSRVTGQHARNRAWDFIRKQLKSGRQAFIVCPRVAGTANEDETDPLDDYFLPDTAATEPLASAEDVYQELRTGELKDFRLGLVHGQMDREAKAQAMESFRDGETQVLVATTVVEVGVDVPNATLMMVYQAERFGLSQLHQLRGRIGRGKYQGYCFLFTETANEDSQKRLAAMEQTSDGFKIAEADFEFRGPGDILGTRQHGELPLKVADIKRDALLLFEARNAAIEVINSGQFDQPQFAMTRHRVLTRFRHALDLPQTG